jgi:hypothetical protein
MSPGITQHFTNEIERYWILQLVSDSSHLVTIAVLTTLVVADM